MEEDDAIWFSNCKCYISLIEIYATGRSGQCVNYKIKSEGTSIDFQQYLKRIQASYFLKK